MWSAAQQTEGAAEPPFRPSVHCRLLALKRISQSLRLLLSALSLRAVLCAQSLSGALALCALCTLRLHFALTRSLRSALRFGANFFLRSCSVLLALCACSAWRSDLLECQVTLEQRAEGLCCTLRRCADRDILHALAVVRLTSQRVCAQYFEESP